MSAFEDELARVPDVLAVRWVAEHERNEVHVLASPGRPTEEIEDDVASVAQVRGLRLGADDIHVVQLQPLDEPGPAEPPPPARAERAAVDARSARERRVEVDGVLVVEGEGHWRAVVTVRLGPHVATGSSTFVRAESALRRGVAEAALCALLELFGGVEEVAVEHALVVPTPPSQVALVTLAAVRGGRDETLVGAVQVRGSGVNEALARAVLDATNRWFSTHEATAG